jgi:transcriptional regulator with XRE-family HTH domain
MTRHVIVSTTSQVQTHDMADHVGPLLREWRTRRHRSQLGLATEVGMSTRHLSYIETGKSRPSPELLVTIADHLDVPLRERNRLLLAAGFAPRYRETPLDADELRDVMTSVQRMLDAHDPFPGLLLDRAWNVVGSNRSAGMFAALLPESLQGPPLNIFRAALHPDGLSRNTLNFDDWSEHLVGQLRRAVEHDPTPELRALEAEVRAYPNLDGMGRGTSRPAPIVTFRYRSGDDDLAFFTTITTFGTPTDVTLDNLFVELFFPADAATAEHMRVVSAAQPAY